MNDDITTEELETIDGGQGTACGLAVGATIALAILNPATLFLTYALAGAACATDYLA